MKRPASADWPVTLVTAADSPVKCDALTGVHWPLAPSCHQKSAGFATQEQQERFVPAPGALALSQGQHKLGCSTDVVSLLSTVHRVVQNPAQTSHACGQTSHPLFSPSPAVDACRSFVLSFSSFLLLFSSSLLLFLSFSPSIAKLTRQKAQSGLFRFCFYLFIKVLRFGFTFFLFLFPSAPSFHPRPSSFSFIHTTINVPSIPLISDPLPHTAMIIVHRHDSTASLAYPSAPFVA